MAQSIALRGKPHIIIATPGRLCDLIRSNQGEWSFDRCRFLVLDEADRLLTPTFAPELGFLIDQLPRERQTLLFTATLTDPVMALRDRAPETGKGKPFVHVSGEMYVAPRSSAPADTLQHFDTRRADAELRVHPVASAGGVPHLPPHQPVRPDGNVPPASRRRARAGGTTPSLVAHDQASSSGGADARAPPNNPLRPALSHRRAPPVPSLHAPQPNPLRLAPFAPLPSRSTVLPLRIQKAEGAASHRDGCRLERSRYPRGGGRDQLGGAAGGGRLCASSWTNCSCGSTWTEYHFCD